MSNATTICALATAMGQSGVGIVRISGPKVQAIAKQMLGHLPEPRYASYGAFLDQSGDEIDQGVAIFFQAPHSFTGEDVLEFQGHGGMSVMRSLLESARALGADYAEPGEFSKRAFLNGKMDLVQAEAVADLIEASSDRASRSALRSLSGAFSKQVNQLTQALIELRVFVEATIDFSDEEIDFLATEKVQEKTQSIQHQVQEILISSKQGSILREGLNVAIAGKPNAGKSSLLNALTQDDSAIVTDVAGTTRDVLRETIHINGMPLNIIDTAGLHHSDDRVEQEGIKRAHQEIQKADLLLLVFDAQEHEPDLSILPDGLEHKPVLLVKNKIDLLGEQPGVSTERYTQISLSAKSAQGIDLLRDKLSQIAGLDEVGEGVHLARERHVVALESALASIESALLQLQAGSAELMAEDLRQAGQLMCSITGEFSSDDLLGEIFSSFCIGK